MNYFFLFQELFINGFIKFIKIYLRGNCISFGVGFGVLVYNLLLDLGLNFLEFKLVYSFLG